MSERIVPSDPAWPAQAEAMAAVVRSALPAIETVHHIGSTSVPGLVAKPIIDLLAEATSLDAVDAGADRLVALGFEAMGEFGIAGRRYFRRTVDGVRTHHLHVFEAGASDALVHLAFRDYLRAHPERAADYAAVKRAVVAGELGAGLPYAEAKGPMARAIEEEARAWRGLRSFRRP